jgi:hypothetical protein
MTLPGAPCLYNIYMNNRALRRKMRQHMHVMRTEISARKVSERSDDKAYRMFNSALRSSDSVRSHIVNRRTLANLLLSYRVCVNRDATSLSRSAANKHMRFIVQDERHHDRVRLAKPTTLTGMQSLLARVQSHKYACIVP